MPESILEEMGLKRKGDIYGLKAMCSRKRRSQQSDEREGTKRRLVEEILKEKESRQKRKATNTSTSTSSFTTTEETCPTIKPPKTRRIALGLMNFDKAKSKFVSVRYSKGGGSRSLDVPIHMTKQELIEQSKQIFFPDGDSPMGRASDFIFDLASFKGEIIDKVKDSDGQEVPFTVKGYFEYFKLSRVQLYLTCQPYEHSDDDVLLTSVFEPSASDSKISTRQNKGKMWRQHLTGQIKNERKLWSELKADEDLEGEITKVSKLEEIRSAREARVPEEPGDDSSAVHMVVQHPSQGRVKRCFLRSDKMTAVYDWVGSLELQPPYFRLYVQPVKPILPEEGVCGYEGVVLYMRPSEEALPLSISSPEVSFKGFGSSVIVIEDVTDDLQSLSPSPLAIEAVADVLPYQIMELDETRYVQFSLLGVSKNPRQAFI